MSEGEVDEELVQLREKKAELLRRAIELRTEYDEWEKAEGKVSGKTEKDFVPRRSEFHDLFPQNNDDVNYMKKKCVSISGFVLGIKFNAVDKKWISQHKYLYTANVKTKALEFFLEVTADDSKIGTEGLEILGIVCHFVNIGKCYSLEITPWVHRFTEARDTSNLFSAISDYTEHNVTRTKIVRKLQEKDMASVEERTEDDGGIIIFLHAKNDPDLVYFEIRWILRFVDSLWRIDNFFAIEAISASKDFVNENKELLQSFCKYRIKNADLEDLWKQLCSAIEEAEAIESTAGSTSS